MDSAKYLSGLTVAVKLGFRWRVARKFFHRRVGLRMAFVRL